MTDPVFTTITGDDFARRFSMRSGGLMWLLGAGASASAGIPTAWNMIWEFKQQLYVSQRQVSLKSVSDISNPAVRRTIQVFIESQDGYPETDAPEEYAALFEAVYPSEADRRSYIDAKIKGAKPSYGHLALATLMNGMISYGLDAGLILPYLIRRIIYLTETLSIPGKPDCSGGFSVAVLLHGYTPVMFYK